MKRDMNTGRIIRTIILALALFMGAASEGWALGQADIIFDPASPEGGSVVVKSVEGQTVTITVTPAEGYLISKSDIIVQKLQSLGQAQSRRRAPAIADRLTVTGSEETDAEADYTFEVPTGYAGALVTVTFTAKGLYTFHIIDMSGHIVVEQSGDFDALEVPEQWQSPLVETYQFYRESDFDLIGGAYKLKTGASEIPDFASAPTDIYVKYVPSTTYDLDGSERRAIDGKKYLLKFADGTSFRQESGDGFEATEKPGIYPYINGEGGLFVYGQDKLDATAEGVASTRTRWAWYLEGGDPYRLRISSLQTRTDGTTDDTHYSYLRTYKPQGYNQVVTGVISNNSKVSDGNDDTDPTGSHDARHVATDYMVLNGTNGHFRLVTSDVVDDLDGKRHTVTSFENYWKTNPTAANLIHDKYPAYSVGTTPTDAQIEGALTTGAGAIGWHTYDVWANGSTWTNSKKVFAYGPHWFQTIGVGTKVGNDYNGDFDLVEYQLDGALILLDQHGWEVMRKPITNRSSDKEAYAAAIKMYDSPMVKMYHFWTNFVKESGYQKYKPIRGNANASKNAQHQKEAPHLADYPEVSSTGTLADIYVTYEVMGTYRGRYTGADTEGGTDASKSKYLIRQGTNYAKTTDGSTITTEPVANVSDVSTAADELLWYVKPNFNIDAEMGYKYSGTYEEKTKDETESDYFTNTDEASVYDKTNGQNGFDPYNLQIESVKYSGKLFRTNATDAVRDGGGGMQSTYTGAKTVTLGNYGQAFVASDYYNMDQTTGTGYQMLHVTNSTFMAVSDDDGNIRLMPRFDHHNVATSITTLYEQQSETPYSGESGTQTTLFVLPKSSSSGGLVYSSDEITNMNGDYTLCEGFDVTKVIGSVDDPFKGTIDGQLHTINGVGHPLVACAEDAVIKNVILDNVSISGGSNVGAICNEATGSTRIYNCGVLASNSTVTTNEDGYTKITSCSSTVSGSNYVGGIVGLLDGEARVINCFSYANITSGSYVGGIVGYNYVATTSSNLKTMVMNCMFYGDITGGTNKAPIYNGQIITNRSDENGVSNYNYFCDEASYVKNRDIQTYHCALMAETRFLQRFEFFRHLLNSHRELAAWWATGNYNNKEQMMKWVLEPSQIGSSTPYPILKTPGYYPSVVNIDAENATTQTERNKGGKLGTLTVNIQMGNGAVFNHPGTGEDEAKIKTSQLTLNITDKDPEHFNFNYYKVQLPYYNDVGTKNYTGNRVVTGWMITNITGGTEGSLTTVDDATATVTTENGETTITLSTPYNYADRNCTAKDLYSTTNKRVFNQGAYWDVPEGVTEITIKPYWGKAVYLADANADVVYNQSMTAATNVPTVGGGQLYTNGDENQFNGQKVYTALTGTGGAIDSNVLGASSSNTVYDYAVVLVGNFHHYGDIEANNKPYTVTSVDLDGDNEPDYSFMLRFDGRKDFHPVRYDFLNLVGLGMAQKSTGGTGSYNFGIMQPKYWFETTNTSLFRVTQFEYDRSDRAAAPYIVQGGVVEQWVSGQNNGAGNNTTYFHVGGNAWFKEFHRGTHQDRTLQSKHPPVSVTGGDYDEFYLTGLYTANVTSYEDNAECYINGGRFGIVCGAAMEGIGKANGADNTGNVTWQIQNADIDEFYAGGINAANRKIVEGNITTVVEGGYIKLFCGGPKFGDMNSGKTVNTSANGTIFDTFFGAGYGGNAYSRQAPRNHNNIINFPHNDSSAGNDASWNAWLGRYYKQEYNATYGGVSTQFSYQFLPMSGNADNVARIFVDYVKFSLATTHGVTSTLKDCTITGNFYGGGSLGKVSGNVTSILDGCTVGGNVFGAGFSATLPDVIVDAIGFEVEPYYYEDLGTYRTGVKYLDNATYKPTTYTWTQGAANSLVSIDKNNHTLSTPENLDKSNLGSVAGNVTLTIKGDSKIGTAGDATKGHVYGGGEESYVTKSKDSNNQPIANTGNTTVYIEGNTQVYGNVFGGGDRGVVEGCTKVNIRETPSENP